MNRKTRSTERPWHQRTRTRIAVAGTGGALLIAVVAAGYAGGQGSSSAAKGSTAPLASGLPPEKPAAGPQIALASWSGGSRVNLRSPGKPTVLLLMAGWCTTCVEPARTLEPLHRELGDGVRIVAVSIDPGETEKTLAHFREAAGSPTYDWGFDIDGSVAARFGIQYLDTVIVLAPDGRQLLKSVRPSNDKLRQVLADAK